MIDIEPLVAFWDTDQHALDRGLIAILDQIAESTALRAAVFATNSTRTASAIPAVSGIHIGYLASARKPLRIGPYRDLPQPGVVIGDQAATDGLLARRLGYAFLHYCPTLPRIPRGPRLMRQLGRPVEALVFRSS